MNSWRIKFRNFLGNFPVHYAVLFINRAINNCYMTSLTALHHTNDGFWYFLDATRATLIRGTFPTKQVILHQGSCVFSDVILVSNYHSYIGKTIKLLPYCSFYGGYILPRKCELPFLAVRLRKIQSHQDPHLAVFP